MLGRRRKIKDHEIAPDEIFLDSANQEGFDRSRMEGRLEKPLARSSFVLIGSGLTALFLILVGAAWNLQIRQGTAYAAESAKNSLSADVLFAPRGIITDRNGVVLAQNEETASGTAMREYPIPALGQIIGYVSNPKKDASGNYYDTVEKGLDGLEGEYDAQLAGKNGEILTETDAFGNVRSQGTVVPAIPGQTLALSLDADLEQKFAQAIADVSNQEKFVGGAGVIMDIHTGQILAIASYPTYDPNVMSAGGPAATIDSYNSDPDRPFLDRAVTGLYAPGSIVKPLVAAGALTDGVITPETTIQDPGYINIPDPYNPGQVYTYKDWKVLGTVDVEKAIAWSSDVFFYTVGGGYGDIKGLGIDRLDYWYQQFGLGKPTGVDLPGEVNGLVPSPAWKESTQGQPWYLGDTYHTSIGQYSMQVTPVQMVRAIAAVANGGQLLTPTLLASSTPVYTTVPVSPSSLVTVRAGMREGVTDPNALGASLNYPYLDIANKTGTAQVGAQNQYDNAWAEGFWPYENPEYAYAVVLERGPIGVGEQGVAVMKELFDALHAENSPYTMTAQ